MNFKILCSKRCSMANLSNGILKVVRVIYIGFAIFFVCFGYYKTLMMAKEGHRNVQDEVKVLHKHRFPSITFCYVFNDNKKYVWELYYLHLYQNWKKSGCLLKNNEDLSAAVIDIKEVEEKDHRGAICTKMCNDNPECDTWTQYFGTCYLKEQGVFKYKRISSNAKWISGSKYCRSTGSSCVWEDYDFNRGDIDMKKSPDYKNCQMRCANHKLCKKWTYKTLNSFSGKCYLKKSHNGTFPLQFCNGRCLTGYRKNIKEYCGKLDPLVDFKTFWKDYLYNRTQFLASVQQRFSSNDEEYELIGQEQYWTLSIPHESSGPCYTYDPPFDSDPGQRSGVHITMKSTGKWDPNLSIFLHKKGKFFYQSDSEVDTEMIPLSKLKSKESGHPKISLKEHTHYKISSKDEPCIDDLNYDYYKCYESYLYRKRGCQYPWNVYEDLDVPICRNFTQTEEMLLNYDKNLGRGRQYFDHNERLTRTKNKCPRPCQYAKYTLHFSPHGSIAKMEGIKENTLEIVFPDFRMVDYREYPTCDLTCIIGQLGGNLGFFLGGSILAGVDFFVNISTKLFRTYFQKQIY